jgi:hypothetical protein
MSDYKVFREISHDIRHELFNGIKTTEGINLTSETEISLDSPVKLSDGGGRTGEASQVKLSLYLYQILPNSHINNRQLIPSNNGKQHYPPLSLNLFYLLTPLDNSPETCLLILGRAMQVLAAHPIIRNSFLDSELRPDPPEVRLTLNPLNLEEMTRIWNAFNQPYRLSVCYQVQVVSIDSIRLPVEEPPVKERLLDVHQMVASNGGAL